MYGRKIEQLTEAMQNILSQLSPNDLFDMVRFGTEAAVWNITENNFDTVQLRTPYLDSSYGNLEPELKVSAFKQTFNIVYCFKVYNYLS